jgi:hypothetical protein
MYLEDWMVVLIDPGNQVNAKGGRAAISGSDRILLPMKSANSALWILQLEPEKRCCDDGCKLSGVLNAVL